ncbi:MAG: PH domain-containing protein [Alphaproteobacteria bacterium]|jgi:uncharacterized membrane protein YdbT with pleckstrin-like domain|nr:PH domain-containing protein [Alphaproteobacteria bacterium]
MIQTYKTFLSDDENIVRVNFVHPAVFFFPLLYLLIGALSGFFHPIMMVVILLMASVPFVAAIIHYKTTKLILTDKKVVLRHGFFSRDWIIINFERIENAYLEEPLLGRIFGFSTVHIGGIGTTNISVGMIANASAYISDLEKQIEDNNKDYQLAA